MAISFRTDVTRAAMVLLLSAAVSGCCKDRCDYLLPLEPQPVGTISDEIWKGQEVNAEASDFVVHEHEFEGNTSRLNPAGQSHVRQIAARMDETSFPIIVELSSMSRDENDQYGYPVHNNHELDARRREYIVSTLTALGAHNVDDRVIVGPTLTPGYEQFEAESAYRRGIGSFGRRGGFGGIGGGVGGFGGFGGP